MDEHSLLLMICDYIKLTDDYEKFMVMKPLVVKVDVTNQHQMNILSYNILMYNIKRARIYQEDINKFEITLE